jgi:hypothetical protein
VLQAHIERAALADAGNEEKGEKDGTKQLGHAPKFSHLGAIFSL